MKTLEEVKKSVKLKRNCLEIPYGDACRKWDGKFKDDRQLFCNIYRMLSKALITMETIQDNYIWVAFNHEFSKDFNELKEIYDYFTKQRTPD